MRLVDLGVETEVWGLVGDDAWGRLYTETLKRRGVDVSRVQVTPGLPTSRTIVVEEDADRSFIHVLGANGALTPDHYKSSDDTWGDYVGYLYIFGAEWPGAGGEYMGEILSRMKERGKVAMLATTADPRRKWDGAGPALGEADIFFCNEVEAEGITGGDGYPEMVRRLHNMGVKIASITLGPRGSYVSSNLGGKVIQEYSPAFDIRPKVKRAAGDSYAAGFMAAREVLFGGYDFWHPFEKGCALPFLRQGNAVASLAAAGEEHINLPMVRGLIKGGKYFHVAGMEHTI
jgi:sugar/nucleoside kinase (ribokinase family)